MMKFVMMRCRWITRWQVAEYVRFWGKEEENEEAMYLGWEEK
jgi:hypothetical protein